MFLKVEYNESNSDLSPVELIIYSWLKEWCLHNQGKCTKTYVEILKLLPCCAISEGTLKRAIWSLIEKGKVIRKGCKQSPVLIVPKDQNDLSDEKTKDQNDPTKRSNRSDQKINTIFSTSINKLMKDPLKEAPLSSSSDSSPSPEDIKAAEEAMKRHGL